MLMANELHLPTTRRGQYDGKMSQYLIDLHDSRGVRLLWRNDVPAGTNGQAQNPVGKH